MPQNVGILKGNEKKYEVFYNKNRGNVELCDEYMILYHPNYTKKIMFNEIDSIDEWHGRLYFSIKLKDTSIYFISFLFQQHRAIYGGLADSQFITLEQAKCNKYLFLMVLKTSVKMVKMGETIGKIRNSRKKI